MKARSLLVVVSLVGISLGLGTHAQAAFHFMKIREVYAGSLLNPNSQFVELQMYAANQTQVFGHSVVIYNAAGNAIAGGTFTFTGPVANGQNQRSILVATTQAEVEFGVQADLEMGAAVIPAAGGKACFDPEPTPIDCVAWGNYTGPQTNTGPPFNPGGGIPAGQSIQRKIASGCATLLEAADDTGNSANDFQAASPSPRPNGVTPTEAECGGAGADTTKPQSEIEQPEHRSTVSDFKRLSGSAEDPGSSGLDKIEIALRQKVKRGCKWWDGDSFARGGCSDHVFLEAKGTKNWSYKLSNELKPSNTRRIKGYKAYSRATDDAANVETAFEAGRNVSKFEVAPRLCAPGC